MPHRYLRFIGAVVAGAFLLVAACGPAAVPAEEPAAQKPAAEKPAAQKPAAEKPAAQKPAAEKPAAPAAEKPAAAKPPAPVSKDTSVNGIPLEKGASFGGILQGTNDREGPSFSIWEESGGIAFRAGQPVTNQIIQRRSWGSELDAQNQAYLEIHADLAKTWDQSADGLSWAFRFFEGIKWSDGVPFTCADAKWSLDTIRTGQGLKRSPRATLLTSVKEIQCPSTLTMVITLNQPYPALLEVLAGQFMPVLPKHKYDGNTDEMRQKPWSVGTGPFAVKEWVAGEKITHTKRPDYWNAPLPYLDGIELKNLTESATVIAMRAGRVDYSAALFTGGPAETLIKECGNCRFGPKLPVAGTSPILMVNHQRPPWNDPSVKDAISLALDREKLSKLLRVGWVLPPTGGPFTPGTPWAMPKERLSRIPGYNFETPEENKALARRLLAEAGYKPGELTMRLGVGAYNASDLAPIVEELGSVGFKVVSIQHDAAATYAILGAGDFDTFLAGLFDSGIDPIFPLFERFYTGSDRNYGRYSNPRIESLIKELSLPSDLKRRQQLAWDAGEIVLREHAQHLVGVPLYTLITGYRVRGVMPGPYWVAGSGVWHRHEHTWLAEK